MLIADCSEGTGVKIDSNASKILYRNTKGLEECYRMLCTTDKRTATYRHNANTFFFKADVYAMTTLFHGLDLYLHL